MLEPFVDINIQGRTEMFYLTPHSTHFILYGVGHYGKGPLSDEKGNPLLFSISSKGSFTCIFPQYRIAHTIAFVTPVVEHWPEREVIRWVHHEGSIRRPTISIYTYK